MNERWRRVGANIAGWVLPVAALVLWRSAVAAPFHVPTGSMVPTIEIGDYILVSKFAYGFNVPWIHTDAGLSVGALSTREVVTWAEPERGDVVLFRYPPDPSMDYVKRVIGVPGDSVAMVGGRVVLNGQTLARDEVERYAFVDQTCQRTTTTRYEEDLAGVSHPILQTAYPRLGDFGPVEVPRDALFVMGDNRDFSADSRFWGFVPRDHIRGRAGSTVVQTSTCDREGGIGYEALP